MYAAKSCSKEVLELLVEKGADPDMRDSNGYNALDYVLNLMNNDSNATSDESD